VGARTASGGRTGSWCGRPTVGRSVGQGGHKLTAGLAGHEDKVSGALCSSDSHSNNSTGLSPWPPRRAEPGGGLRRGRRAAPATSAPPAPSCGACPPLASQHPGTPAAGERRGRSLPITTDVLSTATRVIFGSAARLYCPARHRAFLAGCRAWRPSTPGCADTAKLGRPGSRARSPKNSSLRVGYDPREGVGPEPPPPTQGRLPRPE